MKKFFAMTMAAVMAMGTTAFAAENEMVVSGTVNTPTIEVEVPATLDFVINPYELEYDLDGEGDGTDTSNASLISPEQYIVNTGEVAVIGGMTVTGTINGGAAFATAPFSDAKPSTKNDIYVYTDISDVAKHTGEYGDDTDLSENAALTYKDAYDKTRHVLVSTKETKLANVFTLPKATVADDTVTDPSYVGFRLTGEANGKAAAAWTAEQTASITVAFDFVPTVVSE